MHSGMFVVHYKNFIKRTHKHCADFNTQHISNEIRHCAALSRLMQKRKTRATSEHTQTLSWFNHQPVEKTNLCVCKRAREESDCVYLFEKPVFRKSTRRTLFSKWCSFSFPVLLPLLPHNSAMIITYLLYFVAALPVLFYFFYNFQHQSSSLDEAYSFSPRLFIKVICIARERVEREPSKLDILTCCIKTRSDL